MSDYESEESRDYDEVPTVSPRRLDTTVDYHSDLDDDSNDEPLAYAVLNFPDAEFPIRERSVIIGRDTDYERWLGDESDHFVDGVPRARKRKRSAEGSEQQSGEERGDEWTLSNTRHNGPRRTLSAGIVGSPFKIDNEEPLIPIHSSYDEETGAAPRLKSISKRHLRLWLDEDEGWFMEILGRNGAMINDVHQTEGSVIELHNGDIIQIADVQFSFRSDDPDDGDIFEEQAVDSMSDSAELATIRSHAKGGKTAKRLSSGTNERSPEVSRDDVAKVHLTLTNSKPASSQAAPAVTDPTKLIKTNDRNEAIMRELAERGMIPTGKRGPGRPPKNGLLSNREFRELKKELETLKREENPDAPPADRDKNGKPQRSSDSVSDLANTQKKVKKKPRTDEMDINGSAERKASSAEEPPEDPLPPLESYSKEELEKPSGTYQTLLWQILQPLFPDGLTLQQIYDQFQRRWPHYRTLPSQGWQSSIRHTVRGDSFKQGDKSGKGYMHTINPEKPPEAKPKPAPTPQPPPYPPNQSAINATRHPPFHPTGAPIRPPYAASIPTGIRPPYPSRPPNTMFPPHYPSMGATASPASQTPSSTVNGSNPVHNTSGQSSLSSNLHQGQSVAVASPRPSDSLASATTSVAAKGSERPPGSVSMQGSPPAGTSSLNNLLLTPKEQIQMNQRPHLFDEFRDMMARTAENEEQRRDACEVCEKAFVFIMNNRKDFGAVPRNNEFEKGSHGDQADAIRSFVNIVRGLIESSHQKINKRREEIFLQQEQHGGATEFANREQHRLAIEGRTNTAAIGAVPIPQAAQQS